MHHPSSKGIQLISNSSQDLTDFDRTFQSSPFNLELFFHMIRREGLWTVVHQNETCSVTFNPISRHHSWLHFFFFARAHLNLHTQQRTLQKKNMFPMTTSQDEKMTAEKGPLFEIHPSSGSLAVVHRGHGTSRISSVREEKRWLS